jgi:hypothetical protein
MAKQTFVNHQPDPYALGLFFAVITGTLSFFIAYEAFFERKYWVNTWRFHRYLKRGQVEFVSHKLRLGNDEITLRIHGENYQVWFFDDSYTVSHESVWSDSYIGLFVGSLITKILRHRIRRRILKLIPESVHTVTI